MKKLKFIAAAFFSLFAIACHRAEIDNIVLEDCGMSINLSQDFLDKGVSYQAVGKKESQIPGLLVGYTITDKMDALIKEVKAYSQEEYFARMQEIQARASQCQKMVALVLVIPDSDYEGYINGGNIPDFVPIKEQKLLGRKAGNTYHAVIYNNNTEGMTEEEALAFAAAEEHITNAVYKIHFLPINLKPEEPKVEAPEAISSFTSSDLKGNTVTNEIFSKAKLTVLNVWGTFCSPCISELPELAEWAKTMTNGDLQLVGIVCDLNSAENKEGIAQAEEILKKANAEFTNLIAGQNLDFLMKYVQFVPTTFLVDSNGKVVGEPIVGADVKKYKDAANAYLQGK